MFEFEKYILPEMRVIWEKERRYSTWLEVELAILEAENELNLIPADIAAETRDNARFTVEEIDEEDKKRDQEMVSFSTVIKKSLPARVTPFWHSGVTSFDIWEPGRALQIKESLLLIKKALQDLIKSLRDMAQEYMYDLEIGRTHGVHAEPITFGLKILNWVDELERHLNKLRGKGSELVVGKVSGAVGNYANINPRIEALVCKKLGIRAAKISNQIVSRDRHYDLLATLSSIANSLEKFATNIRLLQQTEISEVEEPFSEGGGSSAMPHKRNPNKSERICSLARLIRAFVIVAGENQALQWHERSLDESANERFTIPFSLMLLYYMLCLFNELIVGLKVNTDRMLENLALTKGVIFSEAVMLALAKKGMGREDARLLVQKIAQEAWNQREDFLEKLKGDSRITTLLSEEEISNCLLPDDHLKNIDQIFARFGIKRKEE